MRNPARAIPLVIVLLVAAAASAQSPPVTPRGSLPGDAVVAAAVGPQVDQAAARGGDHVLVVWSDYRGQAVGGGTIQGGGDIFGVRVDADGNAVDAMPFLVAGGQGLQDRPQVAWNGSAWLVVYRSQEPDGEYFATRLRAVRVGAAGDVLDAAPLTLPAGAFTPDDIGLQVAGGGGQWLVTRCLYHDDGYGTWLAGQRIGGNGQLLDAAPVMLIDWTYGRTVALAANGEFLVAGADWNDGAAYRARRVGAGGQPVGVSFTVPSLDLASSGSGYYVTWVADFVNLVGSPMTAGGTLALPGGELLVEGYSQYHDHALAHDGSRWWLAWGAFDQLSSLRISGAGARLDAVGGVALPLGGGVAIGQAYGPLLVSRPGGGAQVLWQDSRASLGGDANVHLLPVAATNTPGAGRCVSTGTSNHREPDLSAGPSGGAAVAFVSEHANSDRVLLHLLGADGRPLATEPIVVASAPTIGTAAVAWDGARFLVAWDEGAAGLTPVQVRARRLAADGSFLDAAPLDVMPGFDPDVEALGGDFLVAAARPNANPQSIHAWMRIIDGDSGTFANSATLIGGGYVNVGPRVRSDGSRWLVTYHSHWSHNSAASDAACNFVAADGSFTPAFNPATTSGGAGTPDVAFSGSAYLFVWRGNTLANANNLVVGRVMDASGAFVTGDFTIAEAAGRQLRPSVGWDGASFLVAWDDQRAQESFFDARTDIQAARVSESGAVLDPQGFLVQGGANGDATVALLARPGAPSHAAWATFATDGAPHDTWRIRTAVIGELSAAPAGDVPSPAPVALRQNVPNPFNPATTIAFSLGDAQVARLAVYDLRGRLVRELLPASLLAAGPHAVAWDGRGDDGRAAAAGVYLYELRTPTLRESRTMVLAK